MSTDRILVQYTITIRVGHLDIAPDAGAEARALAAVADANGAGRLAGLADDLNPVILDQEKVRAFLSALPGLPPATLERVRGRMLHLNDAPLQLRAYSAISPSALAQGYTLDVDDPSAGQHARARLQASADLELALNRANRARQVMQDADNEASVLEKRKQQPGADSATFVAHATAERKRYAAAVVWRDLVTVLAEHRREDAVLQAEAAQAKEMAGKYLVAPWTGMPQ